jgi:hypothetical protein
MVLPVRRWEGVDILIKVAGLTRFIKDKSGCMLALREKGRVADMYMFKVGDIAL